MLHNRVRLSKVTSGQLDTISNRLRIRKNLLCRMALLFSLEQGKIVSTLPVQTDGLEFNLPTLFGSFTNVFVDLIKIVQHDSSDENWTDFANIHIERGVEFLLSNIKNTGDLAGLFNVKSHG